ncbi:transcriptional regulator, AsnC family [Seinonella peptonophila]|uniref:Transcriptional regulator, AsnC family n=1 Tax=Seinonella peptonophila TaxID=112248 RepID=A0A1M4Z3X8_9BACL|nr:Lrp/AsnC family transcriptional regulator [Seinonella peptonophila]SHF12442.1 transcriptional regulator, AsnC family [Seinonella peptonophila]
MKPEQLQEEIVTILQENSRIEVQQLADMLGVTAQAVEKQLKELQEKRIILRFGTVVNWQKLGRQKVYALIDVKITPQRGHGFDALAKRIYRFPEVHSVYVMSGTYDLSVGLEVDSLEAVGRFVTEKLSPLDSVVSTTTHFVLKKYKEDGVIFDDPENDQRLVISP